MNGNIIIQIMKAEAISDFILGFLFKEINGNIIIQIMKAAAIRGFILGFLFKEKILHITHGVITHSLVLFHRIKYRINKKELSKKSDENSSEGSINTIDFVFKITDNNSFEEYFKNNERNNITLQPLWDYYKNKKVIKIQLDEDFINYLNKNAYKISFHDFINLKNDNEYYVTLDIPFFETFGDVYLYVNYKIDSKKYINVYKTTDEIHSNDFLNIINNNEANNIICSSFEYSTSTPTRVNFEYMTNYLKMFFNNKTDITPELLLLNYDKLDIPVGGVKLNIITVHSENKKFLLNEIVK
jgi:hypothetical protein